jgi:hypothetical protein
MLMRSEIATVSRVAPRRSGHKATSAAKAALSRNFIAALKALRHPKAKKFAAFPIREVLLSGPSAITDLSARSSA